MSETPELSGTWSLNVEKSKWGKACKPANVVVSIEHDELVLRYSGLVTYAPRVANGTSPASRP